MKRACALALTAAALLCSRRADSYVRSRTSHGVLTRWPGTCAFVTPDSAGVPDLPPEVVFQTVQQSIQNWQTVTSGCSYLQLQYEQPTAIEAHLDGVNVIKFRTDQWCHPNDDQQKNVCYSHQAAGITTVFYLDHDKPDDGTILDADVELNALDFTFVIIPSSTPARPKTQLADLENTLTHELGHLQGLDHTCMDAATPASEVDENGNPPPPCDRLYLLTPDERETIEGATMYNFAKMNDVDKRSVEADDAAGICAAYPLANDPKNCARTNINAYRTRACEFGGPAPARSLGVPLTLFVLLVVRRRSNSSSRRLG